MEYNNRQSYQNTYLNQNSQSTSQRIQLTFSPLSTTQRLPSNQVRQEKTMSSSFVGRVPQIQYYPQQQNNHQPQLMVAQNQQISQQMKLPPSPIVTRLSLACTNYSESNNQYLQPQRDISRNQQQRQNIIMTPAKLIQSPIIYQTPNRSPIRNVESSMNSSTPITNGVPFQLHSPLPSNRQYKQQVTSESQQKSILQRSIIPNVIGPQGNISQLYANPLKTQDNQENRSPILRNNNNNQYLIRQQQHSLEKSQNQQLPSKNQLLNSLFPPPQSLYSQSVSTKQLQINTSDLNNSIYPSQIISKQQQPTRNISPSSYPSSLSVVPLGDSKIVNSQINNNNRIPCMIQFPNQRQQLTKPPTSVLPPFSQNKINQTTTCQMPRISSVLSNHSNNEQSGIINQNQTIISQSEMNSQGIHQQFYPMQSQDSQANQSQQQNMQISQNKRTQRSNSALEHSSKSSKNNSILDSMLPPSQTLASFQRNNLQEANIQFLQGPPGQQIQLKTQTAQENVPNNKFKNNTQVLQATQAPILTAQQTTQSIHSNNREAPSQSLIQENQAQSQQSKQDEQETNRFVKTQQPQFNNSQDKSLESQAVYNQYQQNGFQNTNIPNVEAIDNNTDSFCNTIPIEIEQNFMNTDCSAKKDIDKQQTEKNHYRAYFEDSEICTKLENTHVIKQEQEKRIEFQRECSKSPSKFFAHVKQQLSQLHMRTDHSNNSLADQSFSCKDTTQNGPQIISKSINNSINYQQRSRSQVGNYSRNEQSSTSYLERSRQKIQNIKERIAQITQDRQFQNDDYIEEKRSIESNLERSRQSNFEKKRSLQIILNPESSLEFDTDNSPIIDGQKVHLNQLKD